MGALEDAGKENSLGTEIQTANSEWSVPIAHTSKDSEEGEGIRNIKNGNGGNKAVTVP